MLSKLAANMCHYIHLNTVVKASLQSSISNEGHCWHTMILHCICMVNFQFHYALASVLLAEMIFNFTIEWCLMVQVYIEHSLKFAIYTKDCCMQLWLYFAISECVQIRNPS